MKKMIVVLVVLAVLLPTSFSADTCDYVAKSKWRLPESYKSSRTKIDYFTNTPGEVNELTRANREICHIQNGEKCFPDDGIRDQNGEFARLYDFLKEEFSHPANRLENITEVDDYLKKEQMASRFRSMSCENKVCGEDRRCGGICYISSYCAEDGFPYAKIVQDFHGVELRKKKKYENDLYDLIQLQKREIREHLDCNYITQFEKGKHYFGNLKRVVARIEVKENGGEFLIGICAVPVGYPCFPNTKKEFMSFKAYLETAKVLVNDTRLFDNADVGEPPAQLEEERTQYPRSQPMRLKAWNCYTGECDSKTLKCHEAFGTETSRVARIWKLHEYASTSTGNRSSTIQLLPIISVIIFVQI